MTEISFQCSSLETNSLQDLTNREQSVQYGSLQINRELTYDFFVWYSCGFTESKIIVT